MKIVLCGPAYPLRGGVPHFTGELAAELQSAGHQVCIISFRTLHPPGLPRGRSQHVDHAPPPAAETHRLLIPWRPRTWTRAAHAITAFDPELILLMWWLPQLAFAYRGILNALAPSLRARAAYLVHDVVSHERWPLDAVLARWGLSAAPRCVALSDYECDRLRKLLPALPAERIVLAPHPLFTAYRPYAEGAAAARRELGIDASRVLLFFGFIRRYKGLDVLLRALPEILAFDPHLQLLIAGPFHHRRRTYEQLLKRLGVHRAVVIHDRYFSGADIARCFAAADCVILPYRSATQSGVVPIAAALGVPAIVTRVGALPEAVCDAETGYVIPPESPPAIADAVRRFYARGGRAAFHDAIAREAQRRTGDTFRQAIEQLAAQIAKP